MKKTKEFEIADMIRETAEEFKVPISLVRYQLYKEADKKFKLNDLADYAKLDKFDYPIDNLFNKDVEHANYYLLDKDKKLLKMITHTDNDKNTVGLRINDLFREILNLEECKYLIMAHNHPEGFLKIHSSSDVSILERVRLVAFQFGVEVLDSIVVGKGNELVSWRAWEEHADDEEYCVFTRKLKPLASIPWLIRLERPDLFASMFGLDEMGKEMVRDDKPLRLLYDQFRSFEKEEERNEYLKSIYDFLEELKVLFNDDGDTKKECIRDETNEQTMAA